MLNTRKLLYILSDVAYVAELLPGKKEHTFTIQAFRQINGEFINEEEDLIPENIDKLLSKIEPDTYHLVLPDFLFTNTILEVKDTNENKVKQYIKEELLPKLEITKESHEIETFSLTTYNGATKIQLTAIEKSVLDPLVVSANAHKISVEHISPLTWTIKAVISLEPSISVLQIGSLLYVAEHYIGVDQCSFSKVEELENVVDAIKTLKGSQPSIQTVYLLTNQLVEEKLKEQVSNTLPIQQLASFKEGDEQMPSYVKQIIESGMKTLDIPDFPVPSFTLPKTPQGIAKPIAKANDEDEIAEMANSALVPPVAPATPEAIKAVPAEPLALDEDPDGEEVQDPMDTLSEIDQDDVEEALPVPSPTSDAVSNVTAVTTPAILSATPTATSLASNVTKAESLSDEPMVTPHVTEASLAPEELEPDEPETAVPEPVGSSIKDDDTSLAFLAGRTTPVNTDLQTESSDVITTSPPTPIQEPRPVIKNKGGGSNLMKMAFVSLTAFALTVAIGLGVGFGIREYNKRNGSEVTASPSPSPVASSLPVVVPSPSPIASASASIDKEGYRILVVNATTTPGYAGTTSSKLKAAGFTSVTAKNAQGDYDEGFYVLLSSNDPATVSELSEASDLDLEYQSGKTTEDPSNQYDAVIVLAQ